MAQLERLSDTDMVKHQRAAMIDPKAPNPSVEAILHAIIPFQFVDHTHADAVVTITNTSNGEQRIRDLYGERVLIIPYVMPGFVLAKKVAQMTKNIDWHSLEGMVLMNHGVFTFADDARQSYERMIQLVDEAEQYLRQQEAWSTVRKSKSEEMDPYSLCKLRKVVSAIAGKAMISLLDDSPSAVGFSALNNVSGIATRGPLTPDHVIHTKRVPLLVQDDMDKNIDSYVNSYHDYFQQNKVDGLTCLDPAPRWAIWKNRGMLAFGGSVKEAGIVADISRHTVRCIQWGESLGGWKALDAKEIFEVEYWDLEQAKLGKSVDKPVLQGRISLVTGAASGIGKACVESLLRRGAAVIAIDINPELEHMYDRPDVVALVCDVRDGPALLKTVQTGVTKYGGLDIVISNAGVFPASQSIADMEDNTWAASLDLNLSSHQRLLKACIPFLREGIEPAAVIIGSKNVPAPGPRCVGLFRSQSWA